MSDLNPPKDKIFTIDNIVIFDPHARSLFNQQTNTSNTLHATCTRCLVHLLEQRGNIVSYDDLLSVIWPENHKNISYNTFYQCILNLRKAFVHIGYSNKFIITVPKKGLCIASETDVQKTERSLYDSTPVVATALHDEEQSNESDEEHDDELCEILVEGKNKKTIAAVHNTDKKNKIICAVLAMFFVSSLAYLYSLLNDDYFSDYTEYTLIDNKCSIYIDPDTFDKDRIDSILKSENAICKSKSIIYLTAPTNISRVSALVCNKKFSYFSEASCVSYYYPIYPQVRK